MIAKMLVDGRRAARRLFLQGAAAASLLALSVLPSRGGVIELGDTVRVTVAETPRLNGERRVDTDGMIALPQLGSVPLAGLDLDEARQRLELLLVQKGILRTPTVLVEIARYRPIYVGGRVARSGAIEFEPGLTVRHALILAGGIGKSPGNADAVNVPDLRARWQVASFQLLQINSSISRLDDELSRTPRPKSGEETGAKPDLGAVVAIDQGILADRLASWTENQAHLKDQMSLYDFEIDVLSQQADLQENEQKLATEQVARARHLVERELMPLTRLQELQSVLSDASQDVLENRAVTARAKQARSNVEYEIASADIKWRADIQNQLRGLLVERERVKAELQALSDQIVEAGVTLSEADALALRPVVTIYRTIDGNETAIAAQMNTELRAGDILDVSFGKGTG